MLMEWESFSISRAPSWKVLSKISKDLKKQMNTSISKCKSVTSFLIWKKTYSLALQARVRPPEAIGEAPTHMKLIASVDKVLALVEVDIEVTEEDTVVVEEVAMMAEEAQVMTAEIASIEVTTAKAVVMANEEVTMVAHQAILAEVLTVKKMVDGVETEAEETEEDIMMIVTESLRVYKLVSMRRARAMNAEIIIMTYER